MTRLKLLALGVGDAFSGTYYSSCFVVGYGEHWLLVDCPHPIRKMLWEASKTAGLALDLDRVGAAVITHLHADHSSGIEPWLYFNHFVLGARKPLIIAHRDVAKNLWSGHLSAGMGQTMDGDRVKTHELGDFAELAQMTESVPYSWGPFTISCRKNKHPVPTTALRIEAGGRSIGYSSDTCFDLDLIDWLKQSDLIVHETNVGIHTRISDLLSLDRSVRKRMRLIHYPDTFDTASSEIEALEQGKLYVI